ncbi:MAG TPA: hypothetical protein VGI95_06360 [Caulobacteraceae bacterium]|jgi:hypothetical protein
MMRVWIVAACLAAAATPALAQGRYLNERYGYSIAYPADLKPQPESANGDGRAFRSADGKVEALVWASYNALDQTVQQLDDQTKADCTGKPAYNRIAPTFYAISCVAGANILYEKALMHKDTLTTFRITYPAQDYARWDAVTTRMSGSLEAAR